MPVAIQKPSRLTNKLLNSDRLLLRRTSIWVSPITPSAIRPERWRNTIRSKGSTPIWLTSSTRRSRNSSRSCTQRKQLGHDLGSRTGASHARYVTAHHCKALWIIQQAVNFMRQRGQVITSNGHTFLKQVI